MVSTMESFQSFPVSSILLYLEKRGLLDLSSIHNIPRVRVWIIGGRLEAVGTVTRTFVFIAKGVGALQMLLTDVWDEVRQEQHPEVWFLHRGVRLKRTPAEDGHHAPATQRLKVKDGDSPWRHQADVWLVDSERIITTASLYWDSSPLLAY